jgi:hypothetical protein
VNPTAPTSNMFEITYLYNSTLSSLLNNTSKLGFIRFSFECRGILFKRWSKNDVSQCGLSNFRKLNYRCYAREWPILCSVKKWEEIYSVFNIFQILFWAIWRVYIYKISESQWHHLYWYDEYDSLVNQYHFENIYCVTWLILFALIKWHNYITISV